MLPPKAMACGFSSVCVSKRRGRVNPSNLLLCVVCCVLSVVRCMYVCVCVPGVGDLLVRMCPWLCVIVMCHDVRHRRYIEAALCRCSYVSVVLFDILRAVWLLLRVVLVFCISFFSPCRGWSGPARQIVRVEHRCTRDIEHEYSNLSKDGNGVDITALHGMWMSQARTPYTLWPLLAGAGEVLSIPAGMLGIASILLLVG